jgi:hypothetical protein
MSVRLSALLASVVGCNMKSEWKLSPSWAGCVFYDSATSTFLAVNVSLLNCSPRNYPDTCGRHICHITPNSHTLFLGPGCRQARVWRSHQQRYVHSCARNLTKEKSCVSMFESPTGVQISKCFENRIYQVSIHDITTYVTNRQMFQTNVPPPN